MSTRAPNPSPSRLLAARISSRSSATRVGGRTALRSCTAWLRPIFRLVPAFALLFAFAFASQADAAPKYEANFANFAKANGYFTIKGYSFDNTRSSTGKSRNRGSAPFSAVTIERAVDFRSTEMLAHYAKGQEIPKVTVRFGEGANPVFSLELKRVTIVGVSHAAKNPKKVPTELVTLRFEEVKWTARTPDGKTIQGSWKSSDDK